MLMKATRAALARLWAWATPSEPRRAALVVGALILLHALLPSHGAEE
ncbi:hypothetical protein [Rubrivivax gelatinosus]|nr:hypothetical protein [Rubrivivax gelatinosus]